jgi:hypothetical protein
LVLWIGSLPSDPNQPREFPTWEQYTQECNDNGRLMVVPFDCCIQRRMSNGIIDTLVDEDLYQDLMRIDAPLHEASEELDFGA